MRFSEIFIKKPVMTVLVFITILLFGFEAYNRLAVSDLPVVDIPVINITASFPGASPELMASAVASPIENECMQIPGLTSIISTNTTGTTSIMLTFDLDKDVDLAAPDVQAALSRAQNNLPVLPRQPTYKKSNPSDKPILYILVWSDTLTKGQLYDIANKRVGQRINMIKGVAEVDVMGAKSAVRVQMDPDKLAAYNLGLNEIYNTLTNCTQLIAVGSINGKSKAYSIEPNGQLLQAKEYDNLIVKYQDSAPVRIRDLGQAIDSVNNDVVNSVCILNKNKKTINNPVIVQVLRSPGSNTVKLVSEIKQLLAKLQDEIPGSAHIDILYDRSQTIIASIKEVEFTLILAFILVVLVIFLFLGDVSDTVIPGIALPLSVVGTFAIMYLCNFSLDNLSLMGLTLAIGFVVDDAIVVLENTVRLIEEGRAPFDAAVESAKEITGTVVSMTLSIVTVFVPIVFMGGVVGRTFREFALTVILAVICSGLVSLTLTPMMCARMLHPAYKDKQENIIKRFNKWFFSNLIIRYKRLLKITLDHRTIPLFIWIGCIVGTIFFYTLVPKGFLPIGDSGTIFGGLITPLGTSTPIMQKFQSAVGDVLQKEKNVNMFLTLTGINPGADQSTGILVVKLKEGKRPDIQKVTQDLRKKFADLAYPLGSVFFQPMPVLKISTGGESTAFGSEYSYVITGTNRNEVYNCSQKLYEDMRKMPEITDIQTTVRLDLPQLDINMDRDRASTFNLTAADIERALMLSFAQGRITYYTTDLDQYDIVPELIKKDQQSPENMEKIYIKSKLTNQLVPFKSVADWQKDLGPQQIIHTQQLESATMSFNIKPGVPMSVATNKIQQAADKYLTPGMTGTFQGEAQEFKNAIASLVILILVAIFLMYVILGILYESYVHPFTVLTTLPVAAFGGLGTLLLFHSELDLYAYVGIFMLLGIVAKNGIMMVDFANQILEQGKDKVEAIYEACAIRFRPILMTGMAAIMGAVPIAIGVGAGGGTRRSLGLVIVGGLIFSQVITLFVTPGLYLIMESFQEKVLDKFELTMSDAARAKLQNKK